MVISGTWAVERLIWPACAAALLVVPSRTAAAASRLASSAAICQTTNARGINMGHSSKYQSCMV